MTNYSKPDGTVYGRVLKNEHNTYTAYWVVPHGYFSGGTDLKIGEYNNAKIAQQKMQEWIENKWEQQRLAKEEIVKSRKRNWLSMLCG